MTGVVVLTIFPFSSCLIHKETMWILEDDNGLQQTPSILPQCAAVRTDMLFLVRAHWHYLSNKDFIIDLVKEFFSILSRQQSRNSSCSMEGTIHCSYDFALR